MIQRFNCEKQSYEVLFFNEKEVNAAWIRPKNVKPYSVDPNTETSGDLRGVTQWDDYTQSWTVEQVFNFFVHKKQPDED